MEEKVVKNIFVFTGVSAVKTPVSVTETPVIVAENAVFVTKTPKNPGFCSRNPYKNKSKIKTKEKEYIRPDKLFLWRFFSVYRIL